MRVVAALSLSVLTLLVGSELARAGPDLVIGVHDDSIKWTERPAPTLDALRALGLVGGMHVALEWRPGKRLLSGRDHDALRRTVAAHADGARIVLGVYGPAVDAPRGITAREGYCRFVRNIVSRYDEILDVVVWNEANSDTFWLPREAAAADYAALRARCWDVLHASAPGVNVLTTTASSHDPGRVIRAVGAAYRARGRQLLLFDSAGHNPYPLFPSEAPTVGHETYVGQGDYDLLVAVLDESFAGTAQPRAPIWYLEDGFQRTTAGKQRSSHYSRPGERRPDARAVRAGDPQIPAALRLAHCQPRVAAFFNFLLVDEPLLEGWQSGLVWADWRRKPAFETYHAAIAEVRSGTDNCAAVLRDGQG